MPRAKNRQSRSVGNLGDILKHAALVNLATLLKSTTSPVTYIETCAYLLNAPLSNSDRWTQEIDRLVAKYPAYGYYASRERAALATTNHYRCSSGLVIDTLSDRRAVAVLGEYDAVTRAELTEQIRLERLAATHIVDDASAIDRDQHVPKGTALLVHVDPFALTAKFWSSITPALDSICSRSTDITILVYRYTRSGPSPWPSAPRGTIGPVAHMRGGPHELAVYASPMMASAVQDVCESLDWRIMTVSPRH